MSSVPEIFASKVFDDKVMRAMLPEKVYRSLRKTIDNGQPLDQKLANSVAEAMCAWAVENGATHFTHWFQPEPCPSPRSWRRRSCIRTDGSPDTNLHSHKLVSMMIHPFLASQSSRPQARKSLNHFWRNSFLPKIPLAEQPVGPQGPAGSEAQADSTEMGEPFPLNDLILRHA